MFSNTCDACTVACPWSLYRWPWIPLGGAPRRPGDLYRWPTPALAETLIRPGESLPSPRTPTGLFALDALLEGGFPRGQLAELVGPRTSGRTRVLLGTLAAVTGRGAWAALVDGTNGLDPPSAAGARGGARPSALGPLRRPARRRVACGGPLGSVRRV